MSKLIVQTERGVSRDRPVRAENIPTGEVFFGEIGGHRGVFLRTSDRIVSLESPECSWMCSNSSPQVYGYQAAEAAKLVVS